MKKIIMGITGALLAAALGSTAAFASGQMGNSCYLDHTCVTGIHGVVCSDNDCNSDEHQHHTQDCMDSQCDGECWNESSNECGNNNCYGSSDCASGGHHSSSCASGDHYSGSCTSGHHASSNYVSGHHGRHHE